MNNINPREVALKIIYRINEQDGYSNLVLDQEIRKQKLEQRDISFITQLAYGITTYRLSLDYIITKSSSIKMNKISDWIMNILRMGIYQIIYLDNVPKHAIVNEAVNLAKKYSNKGAAGFVNALLKNIDKTYFENHKFKDMVDEISILTSHERWFVELLIEEYGIEEAYEICKSNNVSPKLNVRINTLKTNELEVKKTLIEDDITCEQTDVKDSYIVTGLHNIGNYKMFRKGYFTLQDSAATMVGHIVNPQQEQNILDMCSSPGSKTTHIAELMKNTGTIIACDIYENRLKLVDENAERLDIKNIETKLNDGMVENIDFINKFDKVLVDAPCSGFGVIRRKPDIKWQRELQDLSEIEDMQYTILSNAAKYVKKGGSIIYSTCTIIKRENENIIEKFLQEHSEFEINDISNKIVNNQCKTKYIKLLPNKNDMDGFFISEIIRKA